MQCLRRFTRLALATAHSALGSACYRLGWSGFARQQFERVLLLRGANFRAYVFLGRIAFDLGDYGSWRRELEHARRTDPIRFSRLRHAIELFEPRLAGTQFDRSPELDGYHAADSRATWRALHPFGRDQFQYGRDMTNQDRSPDGFDRGTDLPLAPGYDPMTHAREPNDGDQDDRLMNEDLMPEHTATGNHQETDDTGQGEHDSATDQPSGAPDAALSHDDFCSPVERRRFQLRRPIDRQEIVHCDFNELARRLTS